MSAQWRGAWACLEHPIDTKAPGLIVEREGGEEDTKACPDQGHNDRSMLRIIVHVLHPNILAKLCRKPLKYLNPPV